MANSKKQLMLDPAGYFLIRLKDNKIEVGFCKYEHMALNKSNKVLKKFNSTNVNEILSWIKKKQLYSYQSHFEYMQKELKRASECLKSGKKYVQG